MNKLSTEQRVMVVKALVEGNSIRAIVRMTGIAKNTVIKLVADLGDACARYHDKHVRNIASKRIQCDEIWSFCYAKQKNVPAALRDKFGYGDVWTWTAIDADSKLIVSYKVGWRDAIYAMLFITDVEKRLAGQVQLTTDGHNAYLNAVDRVFGGAVDYAMLVKIYGPDRSANGRYSPPECLAAKPTTITGNPDPAHVSTSYVERQNLTMRMGMRRFTRLTNGFSKKVANHRHAIALHFLHYNFCRVHQTLRVTPAMAAGISDHVWGVEEIVKLVEDREQAEIEAGALKRGSYEKRA